MYSTRTVTLIIVDTLIVHVTYLLIMVGETDVGGWWQRCLFPACKNPNSSNSECQRSV